MSRKPVHIAYLCEFPTVLGGEQSLLAFLARRNDVSVDATVVAADNGLLRQKLDELAVERVSWPAGGKKDPRRVAESLSRRRPDLVHANSLMTADAAVQIGNVLGVPTVCHVRDIMFMSDAKWKKLAELDALIAVSGAVESHLLQRLPPEKVCRIYNGVDSETLSAHAKPTAVRTELAIEPGQKLVVCVGQIALRKAQDTYLHACRILATRDADLQFLVVGARYSQKPESVDFERNLRDLVERPPLAGRTHFLGYREDAASTLAAADVLVVPSRQEPLSRVLLEGLALGVPSVATDVGGMREILDNGRCGILVPPDDPERMAVAVRTLLDDDELAAQLTAIGRERIAKAFSLSYHALQIRRLYDGLIG